MSKRKKKEPEPVLFELTMRVTQTWNVVVEAVDATDARLRAEAFDLTDHSVEETVDWEVRGVATEINA